MSNKSFDCQAAYEMKSHCNEQCDHCKEYYKGKGSPLTSEDLIRLDLLKWLKKKDLLSDDVDIIWQEFIKENP
jgi:MoaA/NifB/PqqE/SkfB family radical SAM enzyme